MDAQDSRGITFPSIIAAKEYRPRIQGRWWSLTDEQFDGLSIKRQQAASNVTKIMETVLGEQRSDLDACSKCRKRGLECWAFSSEGRKAVKFSSGVCARCRGFNTHGSCSLSNSIRGRAGGGRKKFPEDEPRRIFRARGP